MEEGYDSYVIECRDDPVREDSIVCRTCYNSVTKDWLSGLMEMEVMKDVLVEAKEKNIHIYAKGDNVSKYLKEYYK